MLKTSDYFYLWSAGKWLVQQRLVLLLCFMLCSFAVLANAFPGNGDPVILLKGEQVGLDSTLSSTMLLLVSNASGPFSSVRVKYSLAVNNELSVRDLSVGEPAPQLWPNNWQGKSLTITNISRSDKAILRLNLYGINSTPALSLNNDFSAQPLAQYQSAGRTINGEQGYLLLQSPFEQAVFVIMIGQRLYTYTVNDTTDFDNGSNIKTTTNNSLSFPVNQYRGERILVVNASKTSTAAASVSYRLLTQQEDIKTAVFTDN
ncbi:MAG: hypothetical protein RPS47_11600 [Colwellia sp.]